MRSSIWLLEAAAAIGLATLVQAGNSTDGTCGPKADYKVCGKKSHCCRYGHCGNGGEYCAQGCNPLFSYDVQACYPLPVCQSKTYTFGTNGNARIAKKEAYQKVDPLNVDFTIDTGELENTADGVVLTLKSDKIGAKITSTRAMHYGKVTYEIQTAWSGGVITAAVLMGDTTEEADIEFTGNALKAFQSNLFYDYVADSTTHVLGIDTSRGFANYSMDWSKDQMQWAYSKNSAERLLRSTTSATKHIPALPMYVQMSIWPGGESAAEGTQKWAGGKINWNDARFQQAGGQFQFIIKSVTIQCYDEHPANYAYKYIRSKKTNNELSFKAVKMAGYGVSQRPTPILQIQPGANVIVRPAYDGASQEGTTSQSGPSRLPSSDAGVEETALTADPTQAAGGTTIKYSTTIRRPA